jgi:hypothetical protein
MQQLRMRLNAGAVSAVCLAHVQPPEYMRQWMAMEQQLAAAANFHYGELARAQQMLAMLHSQPAERSAERRVLSLQMGQMFSAIKVTVGNQFLFTYLSALPVYDVANLEALSRQIDELAGVKDPEAAPTIARRMQLLKTQRMDIVMQQQRLRDQLRALDSARVPTQVRRAATADSSAGTRMRTAT